MKASERFLLKFLNVEEVQGEEEAVSLAGKYTFQKIAASVVSFVCVCQSTWKQKSLRG